MRPSALDEDRCCIGSGLACIGEPRPEVSLELEGSQRPVEDLSQRFVSRQGGPEAGSGVVPTAVGNREQSGHLVAGGFDYLVKARVADMTAYRRFLGETLLALPGVRETRTYAVMEEVKRDAPLPVG